VAYVPGLKIKERYLVRKRRILPVSGEVLIKIGAIVNPETVLARSTVPGDPIMFNAASELGIDPRDKDERIEDYMVKKIGESVRKGELLAVCPSFFGIFKKRCFSPIDGTIEHVSKMTGNILIRHPSIPVQVQAYIHGTIVSIIPEFGAVVETYASFIQGIIGIGGETNGELMIVKSSNNHLKAEDLGSECSGKILVVKAYPTLDSLRKATKIGVKGIVCGCIDEKVLTDFLGYPIGVAITGEEEVGLTLIITEGFGQKIAMFEKTFALLKKFNGKKACINGATQIRAGVMRPEIIIPMEDIGLKEFTSDVEETQPLTKGLKVGTLVRIIKAPLFGALGHVIDLPIELFIAESETKVRGLTVELEDGNRVTVPRANVEILEE
jgi:hypothetical protein